MTRNTRHSPNPLGTSLRSPLRQCVWITIRNTDMKEPGTMVSEFLL